MPAKRMDQMISTRHRIDFLMRPRHVQQRFRVPLQHTGNGEVAVIAGNGEGCMMAQGFCGITTHTVDTKTYKHNQDALGYARFYPAQPHRAPINVIAVFDGLYELGHGASMLGVNTTLTTLRDRFQPHQSYCQFVAHAKASLRASHDAVRHELAIPYAFNQHGYRGNSTAVLTIEHGGRVCILAVGDSIGFGMRLRARLGGMNIPHTNVRQSGAHTEFEILRRGGERDAQILSQHLGKRTMIIDCTEVDLRNIRSALCGATSDGILGDNAGLGDVYDHFQRSHPSIAEGTITFIEPIIDAMFHGTRRMPRHSLDGRLARVAKAKPDHVTGAFKHVRGSRTYSRNNFDTAREQLLDVLCMAFPRHHRLLRARLAPRIQPERCANALEILTDPLLSTRAQWQRLHLMQLFT